MLIHRFPSVFIGLSAIWLTAALGCESSTRVATLSDEPAVRDEGGDDITRQLARTPDRAIQLGSRQAAGGGDRLSHVRRLRQGRHCRQRVGGECVPLR